MATAGSEVVTSEVATDGIQTASQSSYSGSMCSSEEISLGKTFQPRDAVLLSPPTRLPMSVDARDLSKVKHHVLHYQRCLNIPQDPSHPLYLQVLSLPMDHVLYCQICQNVLEESSQATQGPGSPSTNLSLRPNSPEMAHGAIRTDEEPTSDPTHSRYHASLLPNTKIAKFFGYLTSIPSKVCHRWIGSLLGLSSLALAIVSLMMYTIRSYRMAVWTTRNDELQTCTGLIQVCGLHSSEYCLLMQ